jgi:hypothetical protein
MVALSVPLTSSNPEPIKMKIFLYGEFGCGKTYALCRFPNTYFFDTENVTRIPHYRDLLVQNKSTVIKTTDIDEIIAHVNELMRIRHSYKTIVIDSATVLYNGVLSHYACLKDGTAFGKHHESTRRKMDHLIDLLIRVDMNVILTSKAKEISVPDSKNEITFDGYKDFPYSLNMVLFMQQQGEKRIAVVKKSRHPEFKQNTTFDFSYEDLVSQFGIEVAEKEIVQEKMSTPEQVIELKKLADESKVPEEVKNKWLERAQARTFNEMSYDSIEKCILFLKSKSTQLERIK